MELDSMATQVGILSQSFETVPPSAIPAMLECVMASSGLSPISLFSALLDSFTTVIKNVVLEDGMLDTRKNQYVVSFVVALCHLLKKPGVTDSSLITFIWKCFVPLLKIIRPLDHEMINKTADSLFEVVISTKRWTTVEEMLVPLCLRSVSLSMGTFQKVSSSYGKSWSRIFPGINHTITISEKDYEIYSDSVHSETFPVSISCHILTSSLDLALKCHEITEHTKILLGNGQMSREKFAGNIVWHLCNLTLQSLSEISENRIFIISSILPSILRAFACCHAFEVSIRDHEHVLSRDGFSSRIWECCKTLFSLGSVERRDAYNILSLYWSITPSHGDFEARDKTVGDNDNFDIRTEREFWQQLKKGLVDKEGLIRKQSLQILKIALSVRDSSLPSDVLENGAQGRGSVSKIGTKREMWAEKEAKSMGVGCTHDLTLPFLSNDQKWGAFLLLYETLEEYGTHLVEAAWNHQITLLVESAPMPTETLKSSDKKLQGEVFDWLPILWERGLVHDNPIVRCLIMQSFLELDWKVHEEYGKALPESFVLGPFLHGLNDPIHHKDFGIKGLHSSRTIQGAAQFLHHYVSYSYRKKREQIVFMTNLATVAKQIPLGRAGLMGLAECISSAASGFMYDDETEFPDATLAEDNVTPNCETELLDSLRFVVESSRQHFNHNYRLRVCEKVFEAANAVLCAVTVDIGVLLHFVSTLPRESTDYGGSLRLKMQEWLQGCSLKSCHANCLPSTRTLLKQLYDMCTSFSSHPSLEDTCVTCDDEEMDALGFEAKRRTRLLFLVTREDRHFEPLVMFIQTYSSTLCKEKKPSDRTTLKFFVLLLGLVDELSIMEDRIASSRTTLDGRSDQCLHAGNPLEFEETHLIFERFKNCFITVVGNIISSANSCCSVFSELSVVIDTSLPPSIRGKLGGPSQRRLSSQATTSLLLAITSVKAITHITSLCAKFKAQSSLDLAYTFLWKFLLKNLHSSICASETGGEICLAACEALVPVLRTIASSFCPLDLVIMPAESKIFLPECGGCQFLFDPIITSFLRYINGILASGILARTRRAVLMNCKWHCLESLLSVPFHARRNGVDISQNVFFYSDICIKSVFHDVVESLENAGEDSVLPMLRSVRLILDLFASKGSGLVSFSSGDIDIKMMWQLVRSSWILHVNCKKRRVAPIAALLSAVLHPNLFKDKNMHVADSDEGPLKWFARNILEEGTKSPRTMRLATLHLTGLWLLNPAIIKYYIKELKLISLYGSVQFDEDFEAELNENQDAKAEVALLAKNSDPELSKAFINTELYARVSVAALFSKLADMEDLVQSADEDKNYSAALESGKLFLLELLQSAVNDKDLSKELYKKYSAIHRRKTRAWQMICILSRFVEKDIVHLVTDKLHICLNRNNMPSVRQYLETFAINIYLKFPSLVSEQVVPILRDYDMKAQALSSYVYISANIILHASEAVKSKHLNELLPPTIPLLTSHHHSLRGFTQLLVHHVLCKNSLSSSGPETQLEKQCFEDLKLYLSNNSDCMRLRATMEGYLDAFDPKTAATPAGIFTSRVEVHDFECVSTSLMEQVVTFLNDVRDDLRLSMANDAVTIKNESLLADIHSKSSGASKLNDNSQVPKDVTFDFQKKITFGNEHGGTGIGSFLSNRDTCNSLCEMEQEDQLLEQLLQSRSLAVEKMRESQQSLVIMASLLDRIPNLAGLARTCEVFKAESLAIADMNVLQDKQFQLISVTAEKWVPIIEVPVNSMQIFLEKKKRQGYSILGLEQTANSVPLDQFAFPKKTVLVLGREKEGIPVDIIHILDACIEIPQLGVVRSLNVHVSGAIAIWEYTRQQRTR